MLFKGSFSLVSYSIFGFAQAGAFKILALQ